MFFNVVDAYTYKNYTDAITWPFIRLNNACQCLDARIKHLFSMKIPLVNMEHKHWCTSVHTPCDVKQLMVFDVRWNVLRLSSRGIFTKKYIWRHIKLSECISMLMTCAACECTNQFGLGKLSLQSDRSRRASNVTRSRLSFVMIATDNDVCVRRFVKFARQKSFSG